ncbi:efflux RND transporter periplasmic adaptor subunit, partial [bacterium]|nr:efflux RND transporter periplasmic adaptor subunit [bacterium]
QILGERETGRAEGALSWIASHVNERTRMVEARIELDNKNGAFRAGQFVTAHLEAGARSAAVAVPRGAVQRVGAENVVFVRTSPGTYEPRSVRVGRSHESLVEIDGPVGDDDEVVTVGAFLLKTEISKENIGAGCCEIETGKS